MIKTNKVSYFDGMVVLLFAIIANLAAQSVFSFFIVAQQLYSTTDLLQNTYVQLLGMVLIQFFCISVPIVYFALIAKRTPIISFSVKNKINPFTVALIPLLAIISIVCFYLPAAWFDTLLNYIGYKGATGITLETVPQIILGMVVICILAPILEEYIFRGFLLSGLTQKYGVVASAILSALAFSLMHMNPQQTVYQFILGLACALVTINSGNIAFAIGLHSLSNVIALLFDLTSLGAAFTTFMNALTSTWWLSVISTVGLFALGAVAVFFICKLLKKFRLNKVEKLPLAPPLNIDVFSLGEENSQKTIVVSNANQVNERQNKLGKKFYVMAISLCLLMWVLVFITSIVI